jgi:hypothetical protein
MCEMKVILSQINNERKRTMLHDGFQTLWMHDEKKFIMTEGWEQ